MLCAVAVLVLFLFFPVYYIDYSKKVVVRAILVRKHDDLDLLLNTRLQKVRRNEVDVYKNREDALKELDQHFNK